MRMLVETASIMFSTNQIKASYCEKKQKLHFETKLSGFLFISQKLLKVLL